MGPRSSLRRLLTKMWLTQNQCLKRKKMMHRVMKTRSQTGLTKKKNQQKQKKQRKMRSLKLHQRKKKRRTRNLKRRKLQSKIRRRARPKRRHSQKLWNLLIRAQVEWDSTRSTPAKKQKYHSLKMKLKPTSPSIWRNTTGHTPYKTSSTNSKDV